MRTTYSLGSIRGVRMGVNWSVLVLLGLIMWLLATEVFPATNPDLSADAHFVMAVVASLAFFGSVLLHELGHALQARRDGMEIDGITLWLFGGVARFTGGFPSANAELRIAAAGPAVSAVLALVFLGGWYVPGMPEAPAGVLGWLGLINVALLAFNLIPALPLDGGRLLRAAIWKYRGDYRAATRVSAQIARVIALALIGAGLAITAFAGGFGGIWLAMIAWFLLQAARAELVMVERTAGLPDVGALMHPAPNPLSSTQTLAAAVEREGWPPASDLYPVMGGDALLGVVDLRVAAAGAGSDRLDDPVSEHMVPAGALATLRPGDDIATAAAALSGNPAGLALVLENGRPVGFLWRADLHRVRAGAATGSPLGGG